MATQSKRFLIGYLSAFSALFLALARVPSFQHLYYLGLVGFITTFINMMGVYMMELE